MTDAEYTEDDIKIVNFVQSACLRPNMYTENGTLAEIYSLLIGFQIGSARCTHADRIVVCETLEWMWSTVTDRRQTVSEFLTRYGTDPAALAAIEEFASKYDPR